ncbi:UDP-3-O-(3-hydroxymyristoyl)glucosamine N-acyltransferase [Legionella israelensis]|uniref:UDP-3-O-acylglucosamine N-acyltransferase n=1 Tax=Legionella israelensis TaxID=454 RepID=A0A0W0V6Z3_9GAMM|nr:UDP-3-O-(3-hydroxymyristoyl)glucosamine N-acyltransferase [Legionella israelensis]KTD15906.1 UDP-3-O-[3-hydroxymyristoyl] glucosamine N-acyltransferase [Legionella israelensis]QBS09305.1 UDP-3-O-(3-hydroxymyristoyl)glucosamine N-acyltransferase [Legionella israelensis]SCY22059.1 UDP-3-O-[3-hydroxymyristoyl] glucosamine N-acyltransferase [Legionella israelensis DSM 19235]STX60199.1 UDP-3-O-[3-hydroxymyristoyl] glucosamine N-acyltransferase [Legionella israelensis]
MLTLVQLSEHLGGEWQGNPHIQLTGVASLSQATSEDVAYYDNPVFYPLLQSTKAGAVIVTPHQMSVCPRNAIAVSNPFLAMAAAAELLLASPSHFTGIHPSAKIAESAILGKNIAIAANSVIEHNVQLGDNVRIASNTVIEANVCIGQGCQIESGVFVRRGTRIGQNVRIDSGTVIGAVPFNFSKQQGVWKAGPAVGGVVIANSVKIGANTVIDRGSLGDTYLAEGVCVDNLVQIAHDVLIGANTAIAGCAAIGAHTQIGSDCIIGGASSIAAYIRLADNVVISGMSTVAKTLHKSGVYTSGTLISEHRHWRRNAARFRRLDDYIERLKALEKDKMRKK